jgi:hypothetical protein
MNFAMAIEAKRFMVGDAISEQSNPVQIAVYIFPAQAVCFIGEYSQKSFARIFVAVS